MVKDYLSDDKVAVKNKNRDTFDNSVKVFYHLSQTPISPGHHDTSNSRLSKELNNVKDRYKVAQMRINIMKGEQQKIRIDKKRYSNSLQPICW